MTGHLGADASSTIAGSKKHRRVGGGRRLEKPAKRPPTILGTSPSSRGGARALTNPQRGDASTRVNVNRGIETEVGTGVPKVVPPRRAGRLRTRRMSEY